MCQFKFEFFKLIIYISLDVPQLVVDGLVLPDANPGHLLEHPLSPKDLQAVDLQLRVPDVLQALRRLIHLLQVQARARLEKYISLGELLLGAYTLVVQFFKCINYNVLQIF